jgi:endonuclease YncB( thermonuclease family)
MRRRLKGVFQSGGAAAQSRARAVVVVAILAAAAFGVAPGLAQESGRASATRSDSISLNGHAYQLFGIDGFEFNQSCFIDSQPFACGVSAMRALQTLLDPAAITCVPKGAPTSTPTQAVCTGHEGDIALKMVEQGWAVADGSASPDYVAAEATARDSRAGAWRGRFLAPEAYRAQIAAIEARYAALAEASARTEVDAAITSGDIALGGLDRVAPDLVEADPDGIPIAEHEVRFGEFAPGFINAAIQPPDVFDWTVVAGVLETTRRKGVEAVKAELADAIWSDLTARPSQTVDTRNADDFFAALNSNAAPWIAAGRQPVLFVVAPDRPKWIRDWFAGRPPLDAEVSRREDRDERSYLGTIDGIDVYVGPGRERAALLVPSDILSAMTLRKASDGKVLALQANMAENNEWLLQYGMALHWRDDMPIWLAFPQMAAPTPDAG